MKKCFMILLLGLMSLGHVGTSNATDRILGRGSLHDILPYGTLDGTIWISTANREQLKNDRPGNVTHEKDTQMHIYFLVPFDFQAPRESGYIIKVNWWNRSANSDMSKSATLVSHGENSFIYTELSGRPLIDLSGRKGHGVFRFIDSDTAELADVRRLADGSTSTTMIRFHRVDFRDRS